MPGRTFNSGDYRYGFNGMEGDDEVKGNGNSYTTFFRQYDPRIGRWLSLDPKMAKYPSWSPYVFNFNNPINLIDPRGDDPISAIRRLSNISTQFNDKLNSAYNRGYEGGEVSEAYFEIFVSYKAGLEKVTSNEVYNASQTKMSGAFGGPIIPEGGDIMVHTHPYPSNTGVTRMALSDGDIGTFRDEALKRSSSGELSEGFTMMIESGDQRFAMTVLDPEKAKAYLSTLKDSELAQKAIGEGVGEKHIWEFNRDIAGDYEETGIGFFETTNKDKTEWRQVTNETEYLKDKDINEED
tara:strand:+ start:1202 stop:2086 length:885 start_codon:yes stop_codon:yes gene_type:complete